jgi:NADH-quinone oxidoreductase subunit J
MSGILILYYVLGGIALAAALSILFIRDVFYGALLLLICLLSLAGLFVLMHAEVIAVTLMLIYAGGILTIIIFGIMLTSKINGQALVVKNNKWLAGLLTGIPILIILIKLFRQHSFVAEGKYPNDKESIRHLGIYIMSDYLLAFEMAGLLLLMALIGAVVTATFIKKETR